jgi:undecaprenyl phosphate N,N'-diacetylbacillosamine 1-phosphate transferase
MYRSIVKSILDKFVSFMLLIIVSPIIVLITFVLTIFNKGTPFFMQERTGKDRKIFKILKLKTMSDHRDAYGKLLPDRDRLTSLGRLIRSTSLDELPQLINVLKGDMSLVGPRPLPVKYLSLYNLHQNRRHEVKPGITGWAQINGRNAVSWQDRFNLDVWYVDNISFKLDIKILWLTLIKTFRKEDINSPDATTMKPFTGNE